MTAATHNDYVHAAETLWGEAGVYAYRAFDELNRQHFNGDLPALPIVIGITAFGHCIGLTRYVPETLPRITLASNLFDYTEHGRGHKPYGGTLVPGVHVVRDVLLHEMLHAHLALTGAEAKHNSTPWCEAIARLSPAVLGHDIQAAPVKARRIDGKVMKAPRDGHLPQRALAGWPGSLRPDGWDPGPRIPVASY